MPLERAVQPRSARVIVVANEKGGSGKSTIAMHIVVALMKAGYPVASIDLDWQQKSLTRYVDNRREWATRMGHSLEVPTHQCIGEPANDLNNETARREAFVDAVDQLAAQHGFIVIDTPGSKTALTDLVHAMADILITPLNDSFVDFDVLGVVDPETFRVTDTSHYAKVVEEARRQRGYFNQAPADWIVLRNRLSMVTSRNKRLVGAAVQELSERLNFRCIDGLAERLIFREFYPRGLTAFDDVNEATLGTRPTLSHATARLEVQNLLDAMKLGIPAAAAASDRNRDAA